MKILKKAVAALAMLSLIGSTIPMSASAVTYDPCDVNHDGYVTSADSLEIYKYLCCLASSANYNQYDADRNLIVDYNDYQYVTSKVLGKDAGTRRFYSRKYNSVMPLPTVPSNPELNAYAGQTASRSYRRYSYDSRKELSSYSLTPSTQSISTRSVIGADDRKPANGLDENTGIVHLRSDLHNGKEAVSTGFIVGNHVIATAAHCVYDTDHFLDNMKIETYGTNGKLTGEELKAVEVHISENYISNSIADFDYALITVEEDLSDHFQFSLGTPYNTNPTSYENIPIYVTGCPGDVHGSTNSSNQLYTAEGRVSSRATGSLWFDTDTTPGQSGSPIYTITRNKVGSETTDKITLLAIHSSGTGVENIGSVITSYHLQFYKYNPNLNYVS